MNPLALLMLFLSGQASAVNLKVPVHAMIRLLPKGADTGSSMRILPPALLQRSNQVSELALENLYAYAEDITHKGEIVVIAQPDGVVWLPQSVVPGDHAVGVSLRGDGGAATFFELSQKAIRDLQSRLDKGDIAGAYDMLSRDFDKASRTRSKESAAEGPAGRSSSPRRQPVSPEAKALRALKPGDKAMIVLVGAGHTTYSETEIARVARDKIWGADSNVPYDRRTGDWEDNGVVADFSRTIQPIPPGGIPLDK